MKISLIIIMTLSIAIIAVRSKHARLTQSQQFEELTHSCLSYLDTSFFDYSSVEYLQSIDSTTLRIFLQIGPHSDFLPHEFTCETPLSLVPKCYSIDSQSVVLLRGYSNQYREVIEVHPKNYLLVVSSYEIELQENSEDILFIRRNPRSMCFVIVARVDSIMKYEPISIPFEYHNEHLESISVKADKTVNFTFADGRNFATKLAAIHMPTAE